MSKVRVDLNCDLGESFGVDTIGDDARIMASVTSANIACGYHAGDPSVMRRTVRMALEHDVAIGAHPGFPDLAGFGRRPLGLSPSEVEDLVLYQMGALAASAVAEGGRLTHVKPHGALYNVAAAELRMAQAVSRAVAAFDSRLVLIGLSGSCLLLAGRVAGLRVASEVFADRAYQADGTLVPRSTAGAVIDDPIAVVERTVAMVREGAVRSVTGEPVVVEADTICVHSDTSGSAVLAANLRAGLEAAGVEVSAAWI